jgi:hypothetical protein
MKYVVDASVAICWVIPRPRRKPVGCAMNTGGKSMNSSLPQSSSMKWPVP